MDEAGERIEQLLGQPLDQLQQHHRAVGDEAERRTDLRPHRAAPPRTTTRPGSTLQGRTGDTGTRRSRLPRRELVQTAGRLIDLADGPVHRGLEDLVPGGGENLPTGGTRRL
ncbi:hypothetical protein [Pseudonocardia charpentierae]|uniref:Uncharacterized protein n=1 Tax=Pseudonocardia charpentierae TaxID=3075545 RepID=A0ABU2NH83_9PSEU|nr:hypothetical protein [Pseudonocardia sp. DSM 45834]MDT0353312.1 hypothetical protein [Pseudonocardia sp. DSM 45834]